MTWTAMIPVNFGAERKTRLKGHLSSTEREALANQLFAHVETVVRAHSQISRVLILSPMPPPCLSAWEPDLGRGLNVELSSQSRRLLQSDLMIVHADLPFLDHSDLSALIDASGESGIAVAADHHGHGTNALAMRAGYRLEPAFGPDSLRLHLRASAGKASLVARTGLARDIDTIDDLAVLHDLQRLDEPQWEAASNG